MRFFFAVLFSLFLFNTFSFSQKTEKPLPEITGDTIEGISTDTSIIYIIKKPPVTIRERVEIQRAKRKQYWYLSFALHGFLYTEKTKATAGHEDYVKMLNTLTKPLPGYSIGVRLWTAPQKIITGISITSKRIIQEFNFTDTTGAAHKIINSYNYGSFGIHSGRWFRKGKNISFITHGGLLADYFISAKGFTLDKTDFQNPARLNRVIYYSKFTGSLTMGFTLLFAVKNSFLEAEPYIIISPFSATSKREIYSLTRNFIGLRIAYTNKLF